MPYGIGLHQGLDWRCEFAIAIEVHGMTKIRIKAAPFKPFGKNGRRYARKSRASEKPWNVRRAAMIWFALLCAYGSATATMQYQWNAASGILRGVLFQGPGAGAIAATIAAVICIAHNRILAVQIAKPIRDRLVAK
jgi:hypothetical protein